MFAKLTIVSLVAATLGHALPAGPNPVPVEPERTYKSDAYEDFGEKNRTSYKGNSEPEATPDAEEDEYPSREAARTDPDEVCMDLEDVLWYYLLPVLVYFFAAVLALGLVLVLVHCVLCMRKMCPRMLWCCPCDIGIFHRTNVAEERAPNCGTKEKLQLSLVNVNKHYYRLDGTNSPLSK